MKALERVVTSQFDSKAALRWKYSAGKGIYILLLELAEDKTITVGSLHTLCFPRGYYAYVGSAMGGFRPRLSHHFKKDKKRRWHIDYLLQSASINNIILCETKDGVECTVAQALGRRFSSIRGFGSSDCRCSSHLFFTTEEEQVKSEVIAMLNRLGYKVTLI